MNLQEIISSRNVRKKLSLDFPSFLYALSKYSELSYPPKKNILYVGVGHGLDMITCALLNPEAQYVGVDPFIRDDGNDNEDYLILKSTAPFNVKIEKIKIQEYLLKHKSLAKFDLVVISDCLHHIFVTSENLCNSPMASSVLQLFIDLRAI